MSNQINNGTTKKLRSQYPNQSPEANAQHVLGAARAPNEQYPQNASIRQKSASSSSSPSAQKRSQPTLAISLLPLPVAVSALPTLYFLNHFNAIDESLLHLLQVATIICLSGLHISCSKNKIFRHHSSFSWFFDFTSLVDLVLALTALGFIDWGRIYFDTVP